MEDSFLSPLLDLLAKKLLKIYIWKGFFLLVNRIRRFNWIFLLFNSRNNSTVIALLLGCLFSVIKYAAASDPVFDQSTTMRLVLVPADATVGAVIFRLRASDEEFDYPLTFELVGDASSSTVQIDSLPCTKYNSVCQANVVLRRRLEPGRYYDFQVSVKDTKGGMAQQSCSITATNFTTPIDLIFPKRTNIIMVSEVKYIFIN